MQVAAETMPVKSLIIGVDLSPIKPIPRTISFQDDITTDRCRATIRGHLKGWKVDTVVHDGAPNVGTAWVQDAFSQNELVLASLKLATDFMAPNGTFLTKVFRSKDSAKLEWIFKQLFNRVDQTKPPSSRNVSAETFYVCRGYKAPKHMDPRFLDPKHAFAEVETAAVNNEARVFNPEKKKRKRDGYEEGDWTQFHEASASEFVHTQDPIQMLGSLNRLHFNQEGNGDIALAALDRLPETTQEVRECCKDLKVLGRKEFKLLLRWRLKARTRFGLRQKKESQPASVKEAEAAGDEACEEGVTVESMDEEMRLREELQTMREASDKIKRKARRRENEQKQKDITRMQMHMTTPSDIGIDAGGPDGSYATFRLKDVDKAGDVRRQILRGRMVTEANAERKEEETAEDGIDNGDEDADELERQLDNMYEMYQQKQEIRDSKARAKRARKNARGEEEDFNGFDEDEGGGSADRSSDSELVDDDEDIVSSDSEDDRRIVTDLLPNNQVQNGLSGKAASFFQQDIFRDVMGVDHADERDVDMVGDSGVDVKSPLLESEVADEAEDWSAEEDLSGTESSEVTAADSGREEHDWDTNDGEREEERGAPNIDIITAEAMTLAHALATGKTTKAQLEDDNFNKYSRRDGDGLPDWFLDDENKHAQPQRPVTAEAAKAIKEKMRALNARPIKKVREAKARKTLRAARRLEKLKKKSEGLAEGGDMSEKDKARDISALMAKAKKSGGKKKPSVRVVKAGGANKGAGRPRGVKGKYKMVDPRLKKDVRAEKRLAKKAKGKR